MPDEGQVERSRKWRARLALVAASLFVAALVLEGAGRLWLDRRGEELGRPFWVLDAELGARMQPGYRGPDDHGTPVELNRRGLRGPEVEVPKPPGRTRVLAMGDSVTYGFGVAREDTFPFLLRERLAARGWGDVEVVNAGVPGYSTYQGVVHLERDLLALEPDVVLFAYMNNDRWDSRGDVHTAERIRASYDDIRLRSWLFYQTALGRIAIRFQAGGLEGVLKTAAPKRVGLAPERADLDQAALPPRLPLEPVAADHPRLRQLEGFRELVPTVDPAQRRALCERVADLAGTHGFRLVFVNFYDHPYMSDPVRRADRLLREGRPDEAVAALHEYFTTPPVPGTSGASPMDFDLLANHLLDEAYERTGATERPHYFPRRPYRRPLLHLDSTYNDIAAAVAGARGLEVVEMDDLAAGDYIDHVHLTPRGHARAAGRLADALGDSAAAD